MLPAAPRADPDASRIPIKEGVIGTRASLRLQSNIWAAGEGSAGDP